MISLFLGLTIANLTALLTAIGLGYAGASGVGAGRTWHILAGALAALLCVAVQCVVFTYFMATSKWIRHAVTVKGLDTAYLEPTRSFKMQAFPAALGAMFAVFLTAIMGAAVDNQMIAPGWHHAMALTAVGVNLLAAVVEYGAITRNGKLIDRLLGEIPVTDAAKSGIQAQ
jgi:hypothetical protein